MYVPGTGYVIVWFVLLIELQIRTQSSQMNLISHTYQTIVEDRFIVSLNIYKCLVNYGASEAVNL
jgi:hypothetical protein